MSNYTKTVDFAAKDTLPSGDSGKIIKGTEFETEFDNISTAIATKADSAAPTFTGTSVFTNLDINGTVQADGAVTVGVDDTGYDVKFFGATTGKSLLWDESADTLIVTGDSTVSGTLGVTGVLTATSLDISGDIDVDGTTNLDVVDIDGAVDFASTTAHAGNATFADNAKAIFGAGSDLQIYHDGFNSYIRDAGTGNLVIRGTSLNLQKDGGESYITMVADGAVTAFYDNTARLATTATGIDVTGDIVLGDSNPTITFEDGSVTNLSHTVSSASDNLRLTVDVNGVDAGSRVEIFDGSTEVARFSAGAMDVTGSVTADGLTVDVTDKIDFGGGAGEYASSPIAGVVGFTSRGSVALFTDSNNNGSLTGSAFTIYDGAEYGGATKILFDITKGNDISFYEDTGTTPKFFWDASAESLGIGTSSPRSLINASSATGAILTLESSDTSLGEGDVVGQIDFYANDASTNSTGNKAFIKAYAETAGGNKVGLDFATASSSSATGIVAMTIDSSQNVGIGTSSPALAGGGNGLHINATSYPELKFTNSTTGAGAGDGSLLQSSGNNFSIQNREAGSITFSTSNTVRATLDASGNLGIGTSSPSRALSVFGDTAGVISITSNSTDGISSLSFGDTADDNAGRVNYLNASDEMLFYTATAERMRISSAGLVGIGTSSPSAQLHIVASAVAEMRYGAIGPSNNSALRISRNDSTTISGNPLGYLEFGGNDATSALDTSFAYVGAEASGTHAAGDNPTDLVFGTTADGSATVTERMRIDASGLIQIGNAGSASSPTIQSLIDPDTGIFFGGADILGFSTGGSERMRLDASGNLGIGGTPTAPLHVFGGGILGASSTNPIAFTGSGGTNAGIGSYTANSDFNVYSAGTGNIKFVTGAVWSSAGVLTTVGSEAMRIDSSGNASFNTTNISPAANNVFGTALLQYGGASMSRTNSTTLDLNRGSSVGAIVNFRKDGTTVGSISVTASATAYNTSSDQRLKENIADADDAGSKVDAIQVRKFDWKSDGSHQDYGMVAQELLEVAPEAVSAPEDPEEMMGVDYSKLVPIMLKEIQSLRARVAQLES